MHLSFWEKHLLKEQRSAGRLYAAICASPGMIEKYFFSFLPDLSFKFLIFYLIPAVVLAAHGLLDGKKATSYPSFQAKLPDSTEAKKRVVVDGNCITRQVRIGCKERERNRGEVICLFDRSFFH